jgi:hypothetical protein
MQEKHMQSQFQGSIRCIHPGTAIQTRRYFPQGKKNAYKDGRKTLKLLFLYLLIYLH